MRKLDGRIAHAVRGLKCVFALQFKTAHAPSGSHRSRGAWIEIQQIICSLLRAFGRIAHAVRGLKSGL